MNIEELPLELREDIEDQSLSILNHIKNDVVVIGGWACRAWGKEKHIRHTLDIDVVAEVSKFERMVKVLSAIGMKSKKSDWGIKFYTNYIPSEMLIKALNECLLELIKNIELRIEISPPRIRELSTSHYFEFVLSETVTKKLSTHKGSREMEIKVPPLEYMTANKLGLPTDYKNRFDAIMLLSISNIEKVVQIIRETDDWKDIVLRRIPKLISRTIDKSDLAYQLLINADVNVGKYIKLIQKLQKELL